MITAEQLRAARGLVDWSQKKLATAARLSPITEKCAERDLGAVVSDEAIAAIRNALEKAGVIFTPANGDGPGVKLRKAHKGGKTARAGRSRG